jgi:hypothetical protein
MSSAKFYGPIAEFYGVNYITDIDATIDKHCVFSSLRRGFV